MTDTLRSKIADGQRPLGVAVQIDSTWIVEMCGLAGFDFVLLDSEHGAVAPGIPNLLLAARARGIDAIVRVATEDRGVVLPVLEGGPSGIWFPMVETAEQARRLVDLVKYAPLGHRGFSLATRASEFGTLDRETHIARANTECVLVVTIETELGVRNAAEIAAVDGVDLIFVGRDDLTESLGATDRNDPVALAGVTAILDVVGSTKPVGTTAFSAAEVDRWSDAGVSFLLTGSTRTIQAALTESYRALAGR